MAATKNPTPRATARTLIELMHTGGQTPEPQLYDIAGMEEKAALVVAARHDQLLNLLHDVGYSWGMPEDGILQLAETIESIYDQ